MYFLLEGCFYVIITNFLGTDLLNEYCLLCGKISGTGYTEEDIAKDDFWIKPDYVIKREDLISFILSKCDVALVCNK